MTEPEAEKVWRFEDHLGLQRIEERLKNAGISYSRQSTTVSYFLRLEGQPSLESYELHASYTGKSSDRGDPEVLKSYVRNSYGILQSSEGSHWVTETTGQSISEEEFYNMVVYSRPDRMLNLQQISFETSAGQYLIELNLQSKLLVLIGLGETQTVPAMLADALVSDELSRSSYLLELFKHNGGPLSS